jgi:hypothetical protein
MPLINVIILLDKRKLVKKTKREIEKKTVVGTGDRPTRPVSCLNR